MVFGMIRSAKRQFIQYIIFASLFVIASFSYIEFVDFKNSLFGPTVFYFLMIIAVFNAGIFTQKYIQSKKENSYE